nr:MAG TPA: hypothetical protein [Caudoviricetes sp.]
MILLPILLKSNPSDADDKLSNSSRVYLIYVLTCSNYLSADAIDSDKALPKSLLLASSDKFAHCILNS